MLTETPPTDPIPAGFRHIAVALEQTGGEITPEIAQELDDVRLRDPWTRADPIVDLVVNLELDADRFKAEAAPIVARQKTATKAAESLREYLKARMQREQLDNLQGPRHHVQIRKNSAPKIEWQGEGPVPVPFQRVKIELNATKAKVAYEEGTLPPGFKAEIGECLVVLR